MDNFYPLKYITELYALGGSYHPAAVSALLPRQSSLSAECC